MWFLDRLIWWNGNLKILVSPEEQIPEHQKNKDTVSDAVSKIIKPQEKIETTKGSDFIEIEYAEDGAKIIYIVPEKVKKPLELINYIDNIFGGNKYFVNLDYRALEDIILGKKDLEGMVLNKNNLPRKKIADDINVFSASERGLYKSMMNKYGLTTESIDWKNIVKCSFYKLIPYIDIDKFIACLWTEWIKWGLNIERINEWIEYAKYHSSTKATFKIAEDILSENLTPCNIKYIDSVIGSLDQKRKNIVSAKDFLSCIPQINSVNIQLAQKVPWKPWNNGLTVNGELTIAETEDVDIKKICWSWVKVVDFYKEWEKIQVLLSSEPGYVFIENITRNLRRISVWQKIYYEGDLDGIKWIINIPDWYEFYIKWNVIDTHIKSNWNITIEWNFSWVIKSKWNITITWKVIWPSRLRDGQTKILCKKWEDWWEIKLWKVYMNVNVENVAWDIKIDYAEFCSIFWGENINIAKSIGSRIIWGKITIDLMDKCKILGRSITIKEKRNLSRDDELTESDIYKKLTESILIIAMRDIASEKRYLERLNDALKKAENEDDRLKLEKEIKNIKGLIESRITKDKLELWLMMRWASDDVFSRLMYLDIDWFIKEFLKKDGQTKKAEINVFIEKLFEKIEQCKNIYNTSYYWDMIPLPLSDNLSQNSTFFRDWGNILSLATIGEETIKKERSFKAEEILKIIKRKKRIIWTINWEKDDERTSTREPILSHSEILAYFNENHGVLRVTIDKLHDWCINDITMDWVGIFLKKTDVLPKEGEIIPIEYKMPSLDGKYYKLNKVYIRITDVSEKKWLVHMWWHFVQILSSNDIADVKSYFTKEIKEWRKKMVYKKDDWNSKIIQN